MFENFMTTEILTSFGGLTSAVIVIVQFTKFIVKNKFGDYCVRIYTFSVALLLTIIFGRQGKGLEAIFLTLLNFMMITLASMGAYELLADPMARKMRI